MVSTPLMIEFDSRREVRMLPNHNDSDVGMECGCPLLGGRMTEHERAEMRGEQMARDKVSDGQRGRERMCKREIEMSEQNQVIRVQSRKNQIHSSQDQSFNFDVEWCQLVNADTTTEIDVHQPFELGQLV